MGEFDCTIEEFLRFAITHTPAIRRSSQYAEGYGQFQDWWFRSQLVIEECIAWFCLAQVRKNLEAQKVIAPVHLRILAPGVLRDEVICCFQGHLQLADANQSFDVINFA
jgi:hypothetical protein